MNTVLGVAALNHIQSSLLSSQPQKRSLEEMTTEELDMRIRQNEERRKLASRASFVGGFVSGFVGVRKLF